MGRFIALQRTLTRAHTRESSDPDSDWEDSLDAYSSDRIGTSGHTPRIVNTRNNRKLSTASLSDEENFGYVWDVRLRGGPLPLGDTSDEESEDDEEFKNIYGEEKEEKTAEISEHNQRFDAPQISERDQKFDDDEKRFACVDESDALVKVRQTGGDDKNTQAPSDSEDSVVAEATRQPTKHDIKPFEIISDQTERSVRDSKIEKSPNTGKVKASDEQSLNPLKSQNKPKKASKNIRNLQRALTTTRQTSMRTLMRLLKPPSEDEFDNGQIADVILEEKGESY